jgi:predicted nucleic acid-binding protein
LTAVADTSVLIDYLRDADPAVGLVEQALAGGEGIAASTLTRLELLAGEREGERPIIEGLFEAIDWISVTTGVADRAGLLAHEYTRSHPGIELADFAIAATAERLGARLWTLNVRHFPMFPDLEPPY